ncbi:MAG: tetratricopeptide repeat protein [Deltaproteobacteria bacterium]|nr:tetratricopeptide repeat protein [Deltaproteobacteria bacterium]
MAINKNKAIAAAQKFIQKGQLDKAIQEYLRVVQEEPQDVRTWLKIGDLYAKKGARSDATQTYIKVAEFYSQQGFYLKAVAVYKQILKLDPSLFVVNLKLAELYQQLGLVADALGQFELVAAHHQRAGQDRDAIEALKKAAELDPQNVASQIKLAELYSKEGQNDLAVAGFRRACELLEQQERHDDYLKVGERLLFHKPEEVTVARRMANLYLGRRDTKRALAKIQLCIKADPRDTDTLELLANAFRELGQIPKTVSVYKEIARVHQEQGKSVERLAVYKRVLELAPDDPDAREALGMGARTAAPKAREAQPGGSEARKAPPRPTSSSPPAMPAGRVAVPIPGPQRERVGFPPIGRVATPIAPEPAPFETGDSIESVSDEDLVPEDLEPIEPLVLEASSPSFESAPEIIEEDLSDTGGGPPVPVEEVDSYAAAEPAIAVEHEIGRILTETDVFIKYGLRDKAIEHLTRVFDLDPNHFEAREKLKDLYLETGNEEAAVAELWRLVDLFAPTQPQGAAYYLREILTVTPRDGRALQMLAEMGHTPESIGLPSLVFPGEEARGSITDPELDERHSSMRLSAEAPFSFGDEATIGHDGMAIPEAFELEEPDIGLGGADFRPAEPSRPGTDPSGPPMRQTVELGDETDRGGQAFGRDGSVGRWGSSSGLGTGGKVIPFPSAAAGGTAPSLEPPPSGMEVEEGLEEAEFFLAQGLVDEARTILDELERTHPTNAIVRERLAELREMSGEPSEGEQLDESFELAAKLAEELGAGPIAEGSEGGQILDVEQVFEQFKHGIEADVGIEDSDTHFDLGIAYKEMGLLDDAIHEFQVSMRASQKECICNTMIGLCHLEKGAYSEAIGAFKRGLYVEQKTEREELGLYFELGNAYELLDDAREALYYYQKVLKRDSDFRDVKGKIRALTQPRGGAAKPAVHEDDVDKAFDDLLSSRK